MLFKIVSIIWSHGHVNEGPTRFSTSSFLHHLNQKCFSAVPAKKKDAALRHLKPTGSVVKWGGYHTCYGGECDGEGGGGRGGQPVQQGARNTATLKNQVNIYSRTYSSS